MKKDVDFYDGLPWRVLIDPERQDDGRVIFVASHPDFDGVLGTGKTPEAALADLHAARRLDDRGFASSGIPNPRARCRAFYCRMIADLAVYEDWPTRASQH